MLFRLLLPFATACNTYIMDDCAVLAAARLLPLFTPRTVCVLLRLQRTATTFGNLDVPHHGRQPFDVRGLLPPVVDGFLPPANSRLLRLPVMVLTAVARYLADTTLPGLPTLISTAAARINAPNVTHAHPA